MEDLSRHTENSNAFLGISGAVLLSGLIFRYLMELSWIQIVFSSILPVSTCVVLVKEQKMKDAVQFITKFVKPRFWMPVVDNEEVTGETPGDAESELLDAREEYTSPSSSGVTSSCRFEDHSFGFVNHIFYFRDNTTKCFLKEHNGKAILTPEPDIHCQFEVVKGMDGHYGLKSVSSQKFLGQNLLQKVVISAKKLRSWEELRVVTDRTFAGSLEEFPIVCLSFSSARFGKGLWLALKNKKVSLSRRLCVALKFHYAKNIEDFEKIDALLENAAELRTPCFSDWENNQIIRLDDLSWIRGKSNPSFFESSATDFVVLIERPLNFSVNAFFETFVNNSEFTLERHKHDGNNILSYTKWQPLDNLGFIRKTRFSTCISGVPGISSTIVNEFQNYQIDEDRKELVYRIKTFTPDIPFGTRFSVETIYHVKSILNDEQANFICKTAVSFNRRSTFRKQIVRGVQQGVKASCERMLKLVVRKLGNGNYEQQDSRRARQSESFVCDMLNCIHGELQNDEVNDQNSIEPPTLPWLNAISAKHFDKATSFFESPPEKFVSISKDSLPVSPKAFFEHFLSDDSAFFNTRHEDNGNIDIEIGPWSYCFPFNHLRIQTFTMPISGVPGVKTSRVEEYQFYKFENEFSKLMFGTKTYTLDIPYATYFTAESLLTIECEENSPNSSIIKATCTVHFSKTTMFQKQILKGTIEGMKASTQRLIELCRLQVKNNSTQSSTGRSLSMSQDERAALVVSNLAATINEND